MSAPLTKGALAAAARDLGVEYAALAAVAQVESSGVGFLPSGRLKVLFEGHIFWQRLEMRRYDPLAVHAQYPTLCFRQWTRQHYLGGEREWDRVEAARKIHETSALESTSWGLFQLMGFNASAAGYGSVLEMVGLFADRGEAEHLGAICRWMRQNGLARRLAAKDWLGFARGYNGPGQAATYAARLERAYADHRKDSPPDALPASVVFFGKPLAWILKDGHYWVKVRDVAEAVGARVAYDGSRVDVTRGSDA
jgi:hypothetical protein